MAVAFLFPDQYTEGAPAADAHTFYEDAEGHYKKACKVDAKNGKYRQRYGLFIWRRQRGVYADTGAAKKRKYAHLG